MTKKLTKEEQDTWDTLERPVEPTENLLARILTEEIQKETDLAAQGLNKFDEATIKIVSDFIKELDIPAKPESDK